MYEARAFINPRMQNYHTLKAGLALGGHAASKFDILNAHIYNSVVRSGELVIVGDWSTPSCTSQEAYLMSQASITHMGLMISLALILHQIRIYQMPQGGSITLGSMLPLLFIAFAASLPT